MRPAALLISLLFAAPVFAEVPALFNVQGRLQVDSVLVDGPVAFKFALVGEGAGETYWGNSADGDLDGAPDVPVTLLLNRGLYSVALGDPGVLNMAPLSGDVFTNGAIYLRTWVDDGTNGFQALSPDQRVTSAGHAFIAATVSDGGITLPKLASGVLDAANLSGVLDVARLPGNVAFKDTDLLAVSNTIADLSAAVATLQQQLGELGALPDLPFSKFTAVSALNPDPVLSGHGFVRFMSVPAPGWVDGASVDAPSARFGHTVLWSGTEMIVWGGTIAGGQYSSLGGIYSPAEDQWVLMTSLNGPAARSGHGAVWAGDQMILWGGFSGAGYLNSGARWQRSPQQWAPLPVLSGFEGRDGHVAVWTGSRMLVWGGRNSGGLLADGALYDPVLDEWSVLTVPGAPEARFGAAAVWAGDRLILWGGTGESGPLQSGGQLTFDEAGAPVAWSAISLDGAPSGRSGHTAVWTGERMIIWGGLAGGTPSGGGGIYDPETDAWALVLADGSPSARSGHAALWTGSEMLVFGGQDEFASAIAGGGAYDVAAESWRPLTTAGGPQARVGGGAVWTGAELVVFGGRSGGAPLAALERLNPQPEWHFYRKP